MCWNLFHWKRVRQKLHWFPFWRLRILLPFGVSGLGRNKERCRSEFRVYLLKISVAAPFLKPLWNFIPVCGETEIHSSLESSLTPWSFIAWPMFHQLVSRMQRTSKQVSERWEVQRRHLMLLGAKSWGLPPTLWIANFSCCIACVYDSPFTFESRFGPFCFVVKNSFLFNLGKKTTKKGMFFFKKTFGELKISGCGFHRCSADQWTPRTCWRLRVLILWMIVTPGMGDDLCVLVTHQSWNEKKVLCFSVFPFFQDGECLRVMFFFFEFKTFWIFLVLKAVCSSFILGKTQRPWQLTFLHWRILGDFDRRKRDRVTEYLEILNQQSHIVGSWDFKGPLCPKSGNRAGFFLMACLKTDDCEISQIHMISLVFKRWILSWGIFLLRFFTMTWTLTLNHCGRPR